MSNPLRMICRQGLGVLWAGILSTQAMGLPIAAHSVEQDDQGEQVELDGRVDFTAIVALNNCSGSLVRFHSSTQEDKAMVMTNGHCLEGGFLGKDVAIADRPSQRTFSLLDSKGRKSLGQLKATKILYATMTGTDMALYQLSNTYADISSRYGVDALLLADQRPEAGDPIRIVSGYWKRIYECTVDTFIFEMREDQWVWNDSIRYSQPGCKTIGGTSVALSSTPIIMKSSASTIPATKTVTAAR